MNTINLTTFAEQLNNEIELAKAERKSRRDFCQALVTDLNFDQPIEKIRADVNNIMTHGIKVMRSVWREHNDPNFEASLLARVYFAVKDIRNNVKQSTLDDIYTRAPMLKDSLTKILMFGNNELFNTLVLMLNSKATTINEHPIVVLFSDLFLTETLIIKYHETRNPNQQ